MDNTSIRLLKTLLDGPKEENQLRSMLGKKERQLAYTIRNLKDQNYAEKENTIVKLKENSKTILLRDVSKIVDVEKLLHESNEIIISNVVEPSTIDKIIIDIDRLSSIN